MLKLSPDGTKAHGGQLVGVMGQWDSGHQTITE